MILGIPEGSAEDTWVPSPESDRSLGQAGSQKGLMHWMMLHDGVSTKLDQQGPGGTQRTV